MLHLIHVHVHVHASVQYELALRIAKKFHVHVYVYIHVHVDKSNQQETCRVAGDLLFTGEYSIHEFMPYKLVTMPASINISHVSIA